MYFLYAYITSNTTHILDLKDIFYKKTKIFPKKSNCQNIDSK